MEASNAAVTHGAHEARWITISTDEYESMRKTIEILSDRDLMEQIEDGKRDGSKAINFEELTSELGI
ncbi:MAG: hypothetical protein EMLJLAPB_00584 [Candidatus Argoarchaeum ethanivorans]|uniref:Uncharacterized protein n=1 Tax=Candidatus Argoarchaeum ethanivorans TaxID=2608793 RepID=A0A811T8B2_9EURY|nr:MAG: hypothetical protein EMLJLAPB_00584 [Candidatus Argoarchaeum ethanivorans]